MAYRYIGNKTRLLPWLTGIVTREIEPGGTVADLMCGTASVAAELRSRGFRVIASDLMTFSVFHARVRLKLAKEPNFLATPWDDYADVLGHLNALPPKRGLFYREYSPAGAPAADCKPRQYLSAENASRVDAIEEALKEMEEGGRLTEEESSLLRHDLVLAVNRVANIAGTYGHYWSKWTRASLGTLELRRSVFDPNSRTDHVVTQGPAERVARSVSADLCYLDPPYTKRQYAANYHLIETVARGDEPQAVGVSGLRPWRDQYSDFCSKVRLWDSFRAVIQRVDCPKVLISYSEDGLVPRDDMLQFLAEFGHVTCEQVVFPRFRSNKSHLAPFLIEYAFLLDRDRRPGITIRPEGRIPDAGKQLSIPVSPT